MKMLSKISLDNGYDVGVKVFSGGEVQVTLAPQFHATTNKPVIKVLAMLKCANGIIALAQVKQVLDRDFPDAYKELIMPYIPYARQDRAMVKNDSFSLKVFASMLNSMKFDSVTVIDPHSDVSPALINNVYVYEQHQLTSFLLMENNKYDAVVSPDGGALKKILKAAKAIDVKDIIKADKVRDVATGQIISTEVHGDVKGKNLLIVDDICDGGRTFIELAKVLNEKGALSVDLYITHGIFSKGIEPLLEDINRVYCAYSWIEPVVNPAFIPSANF